MQDLEIERNGIEIYYAEYEEDLKSQIQN